MSRIAFLLIVVGILTSCVTREHVAESYSDALRSKDNRSYQTTIFFLVDGLPTDTLATELSARKLPHIQKYFLGRKNNFQVARVAFPSLTYPSITSLLTEKPINGTGVFGNQIVKDGHVLDFESPSDYSDLNKMIKGQNIFARIKSKHMRTASFDYVFQSDSTVHTKTDDADAGLAILDRSYLIVDEKTIASLRELLKENQPSLWPDFIFVHLIGVDLTSHDRGPQSKSVKHYLEKLDADLAPVFDLLSRAEKHHQTVAMLSADHGFDQPIKKVFKLRENILDSHPDFKIIDEGRYLGLYFPSSWTEEQKSYFLDEQTQNSFVDLVAFKSEHKIYVRSQTLRVTVSQQVDTCHESPFKISVKQEPPGYPINWTCPEQLDSSTNSLFYPYFIPNISYYFESKNAPDAIIIAKTGIAFNTKYAGQHGGPTERETLVPLLLHGAHTSDQNRIPAMWELLGFM